MASRRTNAVPLGAAGTVAAASTSAGVDLPLTQSRAPPPKSRGSTPPLTPVF